MATNRTATIQMRVKPSARTALEEVAAQNDITTSEAMRQALAEWIARNRKS